jgi:hypothetical protein
MFKFLSKLLLAAALCVPWVTQSQELGDYTFSTGTDPTMWVDMSSATQILTPTGNDGLASSVQSIGFPFQFGEDVFTQYSVNTDGNLRLGSTVTGTGSYSTPFSASNANTNSPKINAFGCDGYGVSGSHYVKAQNVGDSMLVVEFCMGTYNTNSRDNLYKWQVQLHTNGNIAIVFPDTVDLPAANPAVSHQCGLCVNSTDGWIINGTNNTATHFTSGSSTTNASGTWFDGNRYYYFVRPVVTCPKPAWVMATDVTSDAATIYWTYGGEESTWMITLNDSLIDNAAIDTFYILSDLSPNTSYTVSLYALCDDGDTSTARNFTFQTACGDLTVLPYTMGFETSDGVTSTGSSTSTTFVNCWHRINNGSSYFGYPYVSSSSTYAHTGSRGLYWYNTSTTGTYGDYQVIVLPPVDTNLYPTNTLMLRFWAKCESSSYNPDFLVGVMTDPDDISTFQQVGPIVQVRGTAWAQYEAYFNSYVGEGKYIALRANRASSSWYVYADDFTLRQIPACMEVRNVQVNSTVGAAIVSWDASVSDEQCHAIVEYKADTATEWIEAGVAQNLALTITGLAAATDYNVRVKALCNEEADTSDVWVYADFTTSDFGCAVVDPNTYFSDTLVNGTTTSSYIPSYSTYNYSLTQQIFTAAEIGHGGSISRIQIMPSAYTVPRILEVYMGHVSQATATSYLNPSDLTLVYNSVTTLTLTAGQWNELVLSTPFNYNGSDNLLIYFRDMTGSWSSGNSWYGDNGTSGVSRYIYQDGSPYAVGTTSGGTTSTFRANLIIGGSGCLQQATCAAPAAAVAAADSASVTLSWAPGANETQWEVWYKAANDNGFTVAATAVSDMYYTVDNLNPGMEYTFRVVNICDPDTFFSQVSAFTECAPVNVVFDDFESYATGNGAQLNPCWYQGNYNETSTYPYVTTYDGHKCLYFYTYNSGSTRRYTWLALPQMADSVNTYEVEFDMRKYSTTVYYFTQVMIGAMTDPTDITTFDTIATLTATTYGLWEPFYCSLENYHGEGQYIAILAPDLTMAGQSNVYNYVYLDNLYVGRRSTCTKPTRFHARDITANSAVLAWDSVADYQNLKVYYNTVNDITSATEVNTTDASVYISGLNATTTYYCWLTAFCTDDSSRTVTCSFTTTDACNPVLNLTVAEATDNMASITWQSDDITPASNYTFEWKDASSTTWNTVTTGNTYYQLTNLTAGTTYEVRVTAACDDVNANPATVSFTTTVPGTIGNNEGTYYLPTYPYYNYSISEQMWTASELSIYGDTIHGISFNATSAITERDMSIWIVDTTLADLSTTNYVPSTAMTLVMDSVIDIVAGWNYFPFDEPYVRDVNKNLVVLVYDQTGSYESFDGFVASTSTVNSLYAYQDGAPYSTTDLSTLTAEGVRAQMQLGATISQPTCAAPHPVVAGVTDNSISLTWIAGLNETAWSVDYRGLADTVWTQVTASTSSTSITVNGLTASTSYIFRIGALCSGETMYAAVRGTTACGQFDVPYVEDFNVYSNNEYDFDPCWYKGNMINTNMPYIANITGQGLMMLMPQGSYVIFPQVGTDVSALRLRMQYVVADASIYALVGVCSHPEDILSMTVIDTVRATAAGVPEWVTIPFDSYNNAEGYIAIYSNYNQTYYDNINIELIPMCTTVDSISATNITTTGADLSWQGANNAGSYIVEYGPLGTGVYNTVAASAPSLTLGNLLHSTTYDVNIYTVCPTLNDTSIAANFHFTTECDSVSLPYFEDFEHCNAPALTQTYYLPNCWQYVMTGTSATYTTGAYVPMLYSNTTYASSGNYSLRLYGRTVIALPEMPVSANQLMISFHEYNTSSSYYRLVIGVCDSNWGNFQQSFVPVDTIAVNQASNSIISFKLASYTGSGRYIAFTNYYYNSTSDYSYHYIDDITVDYLPSCMPVDNLHSNANTSTSISIDWTDLGTPSGNWIVSYSTSPLTDPMTGTVSVATAHPYNVTGLTAGTDYYFYVRSDCGSGDSSMWMAMGPVTPGSWNMRPNVTDTLYMCGGVIYDDAGTSTGYANSQDSYIILYPDSPQNLVSLNGTVATETCCDRVVIYDGVGTSGTELFYGYGTVSDVTSTSGPLTIYFHTDGSVNSYQGFELHVSCIATTCMVTNLDYDTNYARSSTELNLAWDDIGALKYEIVYGTPGFDHEDATNTVYETTTNSYTIAGLTASTSYEVYVRGICTDGDTGSWVHQVFQTSICDNAVEVSTGEPSGTTYYAPVNNYYRYTLTETIIDSAELAGVGEIAAIAYSYAYSSPSTAKTDVTIYLQPTTKTTFSGTSDIEALDSVNAVQVYKGALNCSQGWNIFTFDSVTYTWDGVSNLMVIVVDSSYDYDGNSYVFNASPCTGTKTLHYYSDTYVANPYNPGSYSGTKSSLTNLRPTMKLISCGAGCSKPSGLSVTNVTYNSATLNWIGSADNFEVAVKATTEATWPAPVAVSGATFYDATGLVPETQYQYMVRAICDAEAGLISDWVSGTFTTDELPCLEPTDLEVDPGYATATLTWNAGGAETEWTVRVWNSSVDTTYHATATTFTVTNLSQNTAYNAAVKSICGGGAAESEYGDTVSFTTATCAVVTGVTATATSATTATVSWTSTEASQYVVSYGERGFLVNDGITVTATGNSIELTGLSAENDYDVYVRAMCEQGVYSTWSTVAQFSTPAVEGIATVDGIGLSIYPNPTTSATTIALSGVNGEVAITIVDMNGRVVKSDSMSCEGDCTKTMEVSGLAQGAYFVRISGENVNMVKKLVVK